MSIKPVKSKDSTIFNVVVLSLCAVFFVLAIGITLLSSNIYRNVNAASEKSHTYRVSLSYVVNQVRRNDGSKIYLGEFDGQSALMLFDAGDDRYATIIYCYDGQLRELYVDSEYLHEFYASDGIAVVELESLSITLDNALLTIEADGRTVTLSPHCPVEEVGAL